MPPPEPEQPPGQEELERRLPGYRRIVIPRELTLIELLVSFIIFGRPHCPALGVEKIQVIYVGSESIAVYSK